MLKPLGLDRVTSDVIVKPGLGPMCLSSFEAFRRGWRLMESSSMGREDDEDLSTQAPTSRGIILSVESTPHINERRHSPHLIVTNYASLKDWKRCCVCDHRTQCDQDCPNVIIYTCNESGNSPRVNEDLEVDSNDNSGTTFVVTTYATLNARAEKFKRQPWGAIILEFSLTIPFPHSYMIDNLLSLKCLQWFTINKPLMAGQKFETRWQDIHREALRLHRSSGGARDRRVAGGSVLKSCSSSSSTPPSSSVEYNTAAVEYGSKRPSLMVTPPPAAAAAAAGSTTCEGSCAHSSAVVGGTFWSYMEPGIGSDAANEPLPGCHSVLSFIADWRPSAANAHVRLSCPVFSDGIWFVRAEPCEMDKQMLEIALANTSADRYEELYNEYFLTTHCPLDFAQLRCLVCGSTCADVLLRCCKSVFHRDCFLTELLCEMKCPNCGVEPQEDLCEPNAFVDLEARLLSPGSYCLIDLYNREYRNHDWSCQLTRQVITSAIQGHLTKISEAGDWKLKCLTARVHNAEALTSKIFHETRELPFTKRIVEPSSRYDLQDWRRTLDLKSPDPPPPPSEELYIFFTAKSTECLIKPRNDRERFIVITLVSGILDQTICQPILGANNDPLSSLKFKLQV